METRTVRGKIRSTGADIEVMKGEAGDERRFTGYASTPNMDRMKEVIETRAFAGTLKTYKQNPIMLYMHNSREPIGHFDSFELRDAGLFVTGVVGEGFHPADRVWKMITQGHLKALSIGFREIDGEVKEIKDDKGNKHEVYHITKLELLEISVVAVPANREALFTYEDGKLIDIKMLDEDDNPDEKTEDEVEKTEDEPTSASEVEAAIKEIEEAIHEQAAEETVAKPEGETKDDEPTQTLCHNSPVISPSGELLGHVAWNSTGDVTSTKFFFSPPCSDNGYEVNKELSEKVEALEQRIASLEKRSKDLEIAVVGALRVIVREVKERQEEKSKRANGCGPDGVLETV